MTRLSMPNRRIRGRMYGGVGGEVSDGLPYPMLRWGNVPQFPNRERWRPLVGYSIDRILVAKAAQNHTPILPLAFQPSDPFG